jgi:hypothetical protein
MFWYQYIALVSSGIFVISFLFHLIRMISLGKPHDFALPAGRTGPSVLYSFTGAMNPAAKETAFLHLPTYTAGILFHLGSFLALFLFILIWFIPDTEKFPSLAMGGFLLVSASCGIGILIKRISRKKMRTLSNPDDYLANALVTLFQLITAAMLISEAMVPAYFLLTSILLLYFPLGKLRHALYFFAARYHLGLFYGVRGVWPPKHIKSS